MVVGVNGKYRLPLTNGDRYRSCIRLEPEGLARFVFVQEIYRSRDNKLAFLARVIGVALNERGRPLLPESLAAILSELS